MQNETMTEAQAMLELSMLSAESEGEFFDTQIVDALKRGLPPEFVTRMKDLWETSKVVGGEVIAVGRIIVLRILAFLKANPNLSVALGVAAAAYMLSHSIPFVGSMLAPIIALAAGGLVLGKSMDLEKAIELARQFLVLLVDIFLLIRGRIDEKAWARSEVP